MCDLVVKVISIRPGTGVSKNSKTMHLYPKKPSMNVCKQIKQKVQTAVRMVVWDTYFNQFGFEWLLIVSHATGYDLVGFLTSKVLF